MPFIPHTPQEVQEMLSVLGVEQLEQLFEEIPGALLCQEALPLPTPLNEIGLTRLMRARAGQDRALLCFAGAGAYEHHIPAAIWEIATRGEYYSAYTPYQAEASQGTLQVLYEYQSMMAALLQMEVVNASLYDGATALAEAILMAIRSRPNLPKRVLLPDNLHPHYRQVLQGMLTGQAIEMVALPFDRQGGQIDAQALAAHVPGSFAALVVAQPNFFGTLEDVEQLTDWAHAQQALLIAVVNPLSLGLLQAPGSWGTTGADIACGEGQPLGIPLSSGGPYFGFMGCKQSLLRQMPGRIAGRTLDRDQEEGFVLTLQAREQHIRRAKATSNICTNQGLMTVAATIYLSLLGPTGLQQTALACHQNTMAMATHLQQIPGVRLFFDRPFFHEIVLQLPVDAQALHTALEREGFCAGVPLGSYYPEMANMLLLCATEMRTADEMEQLARAMRAQLPQER
ncbi:MAG: aminomethyl-transferring glycine dehydrogenase subunit GcvPA [Magnetococcales bacterium]|nr:aminomethyl-transferring glycine dehydrogenase subunit GcvPA [Magnetococcales bacterium]MBF0114170.1 aminomethyl-transferring glycine dehydrogenase subunit GcvPA [Magnetococcales bacterium]